MVCRGVWCGLQVAVNTAVKWITNYWLTAVLTDLLVGGRFENWKSGYIIQHNISDNFRKGTFIIFTLFKRI